MGKKKSVRIMVFLAFLLVGAVILRGSVARGVVFAKVPLAHAEWMVHTTTNYIGDVIEATIHITTKPGALVFWDKLPSVGDVWQMPDKYVPSQSAYGSSGIPEGELEVVSRVITSTVQENEVVTDITFGLLYLLPLDKSQPVDDKRMPYFVSIFQEYLLQVESGEIKRYNDRIPIQTDIFEIAPRVDENSQPILKLFEVTAPGTHWSLVKLVGWAVIGLGLSILFWRWIRIVRSRRDAQKRLAEETIGVEKLYGLWRQSHDHQIFHETLARYSQGAWGRPKAVLWGTAIFILFSGVSLSPDQVESVFAQIIREVSHEPAI